MTDIVADKTKYSPRNLFELTGRYKYVTGYQGPHAWIFLCGWKADYLFLILQREFLIGLQNV
jgi:hypothetical protein